PAWGPELLARSRFGLGTVNGMAEFSNLYKTWERWSADVAESHSTYLTSCWLRSPRPEPNWPISLLGVMAAGAIPRSLTPPPPPPVRSPPGPPCGAAPGAGPRRPSPRTGPPTASRAIPTQTIHSTPEPVASPPKSRQYRRVIATTVGHAPIVSACDSFAT